MNDMRKLMETVAPLFEWDDSAEEEYDFQEAEDFLDWLGEQGASRYELEVVDQAYSGEHREMTLSNDNAMTIGVVNINIDGSVNFDMYRRGEGIPLDSHYFETMGKAAADQILDLMGMPLENTIGRRPHQ